MEIARRVNAIKAIVREFWEVPCTIVGLQNYLFVAEGFDGAHLCGSDGWVEAEDDAHDD